MIYTLEKGEIRYLLVRSRKGVYGFAKGHMEPGETETETAYREIREETGLTVRLLDGFRAKETYLLPQKENTVKEVVYFIGFYSGQTPHFQEKELTAVSLHSFEEAMTLLQSESRRKVLAQADAFIRPAH